MMVNKFLIQRLYKSRGLTQESFAQLAHISARTISTILKDGTVKKPKDLTSIASVLGVPESDLLRPETISPSAGQLTRGNRVDEALALYLVDETDVTITASGSEFRDIDNGMVLMTIPLVDEFAYASYPRGWKDAEYIEDLPKHSIVLPRRDKGLYRAFAVRGDSMDDNTKKAICPGDIAIGRNIEQDLWDSKLYVNGGKDYIIVHHDGIMIKRVVQHQVKEGILHCISTNPDKATFPDFSVNLAEVYELYMIYKVERDWRN